jgi:hypothetical protein
MQAAACASHAMIAGDARGKRPARDQALGPGARLQRWLQIDRSRFDGAGLLL